jgi:hypothetical protein
MMNEPESTPAPTPPATADTRAASASGIAATLTERLARDEALACFRSVGRQFGLKPDQAAHAFELSGLKPDHSNKSDEQLMRSAIEMLRVKHGDLFDSDPDLIPDSDPRLRDAGWMAKNQDKLVAHSRAKLRRLGLS